METCRENVLVLCHSNGCIKNGPDGVYFEGSTLKKFRVKRKTKLSRLLDGIYLTFGLDKQRSKVEIFGRYPVVVSPNQFWYLLFPVVSDSILETMLEVPSNHLSINCVELYLELKSTFASDDVIDPPAGSSSKRQRTQPCLQDTSLWIDDDHDMPLGLRFKDRGELKKAVHWWSIRRRRKCVVRETEKDMYRFECVRLKCKWSICAARMEEDGLFKITKSSAPHTCCPEDFEAEFVADEIERVVRVHPTLSIAELNKWWTEKTGYELETSKMREGKLEVIKRVFGEEVQSFRVIPKLMSAFRSSNRLLIDWQYDPFPNPKFASFCGVFWAFSQSIEGFQHCRPLIIVDTRNLNGQYQLKLMIASGVDAANKNFPLAFAVTKEVSTDSWRWFLNNIREKVTQRKGICLISSPQPEILEVINEPGSRWKEPWAYHRFCLKHLRYQFYDIFENGELECLVEKAGHSCQRNEFGSYMNDIKEKNPKARRWLDQFLPHQWSLAHDSGLRYGIMEIDQEALFSVCRGFPYYTVATSGVVVLMFDELRDAFDESITCSSASLNRGDVYTKPVMDKIEAFMKDSATYVIKPLERHAIQVSDPTGNEEWIVQLNDSICSCGEFQAYKFPCLHALALCDQLKMNPLQYVDDCYTLELYHKTYAAKFNHVPQVSAWPEASGVPTLFPPVIVPSPSKVSGKRKDKTDRLKGPLALMRKKLRTNGRKARVWKKKGWVSDLSETRFVLAPNDEELRNAIGYMLKEMDYKMDSLTDIPKRLTDKFRIDLTPRKSSIEVMVQKELDKCAVETRIIILK